MRARYELNGGRSKELTRRNRQTQVAASSIILWYVSASTLLIRVFHGVNCESVARRAGRGVCDQIRGVVDVPATSEGTRSAEESAVSDPREGAQSMMQVISNAIADRVYIIRLAP